MLLENPATALRQHRIPLREGWEYVKDSQKINRQTGAAHEGIRKSQHQSRMVLKNIGEDTAQNPPGLLPDGAGREVSFLAEG